MNYPESKAADEHFQNLVAQYSDSVQHVRALCDEATDSSDFIKMSGECQIQCLVCKTNIRQDLRLQGSEESTE
jgi:vinculin